MTRNPPSLLRVADALAVIAGLAAAPARPLAIDLDRACGRILAEPAVSCWPMPRFDNSAVDGWAVRLADLDPDDATDLPILGRLAAGEDAGGVSVAGGAVRIFTGAMVPADADAVVMQEQVQPRGARVRLPADVARGCNIRRAGENGPAGSLVLVAGQRLRPQHLALAAAAGLTRLTVRDTMRVALLSTGNEVRPIGSMPEAATVPDQNGLMLAALLDRPDLSVDRLGILGDNRDRLTAQLIEAARTHDLVVTSGGVSVGEEDHLVAALRAAGNILFWRLAMKPGRPVALALVAGVPVLALPGNPVAAFTSFAVLGPSLLDRLSGQATVTPGLIEVRAAFTHASRSGMRDYLPVSLRRAGATWEADVPDRQGLGGLALLGRTDGFVEIAEERTAVAPGDLLPFRAHPACGP